MAGNTQSFSGQINEIKREQKMPLIFSNLVLNFHWDPTRFQVLEKMGLGTTCSLQSTDCLAFSKLFTYIVNYLSNEICLKKNR